jgi:hypothetical protein
MYQMWYVFLNYYSSYSIFIFKLMLLSETNLYSPGHDFYYHYQEHPTVTHDSVTMSQKEEGII